MINKSKKDKQFIDEHFREMQKKLLGKKSQAEDHFKRLLTEAGIYFRREKCNYRRNTRWCYYDFYLPYYHLYIELDGESHNSAEQQAIDREKEDAIFRRQRYILRLKNEDVFRMESVEIDGLLDLWARQRFPKRYRGRPPRRRLKYELFLDSQRRDSRENISRVAKFPIDPNQEIWLYDHEIGLYFCFADIFEAKFTVEMGVHEIHELLERTIYFYNPLRRYVFAYTKEECEKRAKRAFIYNPLDDYARLEAKLRENGFVFDEESEMYLVIPKMLVLF